MTEPLPFTVHGALRVRADGGLDDLLIDRVVTRGVGHEAVVDARQLVQEPAWRCGHQVADRLLDEVELRCERSGDLARAIRAAELRCALPFDDDASDEAGLRLRRLRARLN